MDESVKMGINGERSKEVAQLLEHDTISSPNSVSNARVLQIRTVVEYDPASTCPMFSLTAVISAGSRSLHTSLPFWAATNLSQRRNRHCDIAEVACQKRVVMYLPRTQRWNWTEMSDRGTERICNASSRGRYNFQMDLDFGLGNYLCTCSVQTHSISDYTSFPWFLRLKRRASEHRN